ncbi:MAG: hypothetical protein PHQ74_05660 [Crocinitomicaceae bacterium]|nr:hypothetical protein [Crocinitomicaceae bacterium]
MIGVVLTILFGIYVIILVKYIQKEKRIFFEKVSNKLDNEKFKQAERDLKSKVLRFSFFGMLIFGLISLIVGYGLKVLIQ